MSYRRLVFLAGVVVVGMIVASAIRTAWKAVISERCLQGVNCVSNALAGYVEEHGKWPESWQELETFRPEISRGSMYDWPEDSEEIQKYVEVRFDVDLNDIDADRLDGVVIGAEQAFYQFEHRLEELRAVIRRHQEE